MMQSLFYIVFLIIGVVQSANAGLNYYDTFKDSSLDTGIWTSAGSVTEGAGNISIQGNATWNANGIVSGLSNTAGQPMTALFTVKIPSTTGIEGVFGFGANTLGYNEANRFMVYLYNGGIRILRPSGASTTTAYSYSTSTTYQFRMKWASTWFTVDVKGGAYSDWTTVYHADEGVSVPQRYLQAQAYRADAPIVFTNIGTWVPGNRANFSDNFAASNIDTVLWTSAGSANISAARLNMAGANSWNTTGVVSKRTVTGGTHVITADVVTPSTISAGISLLLGWSRSSTLSYAGSDEAQLFFYGTSSKLYAKLNASAVDTGYSFAANTTYNVRLTYNNTSSTTVTFEIKGGAYTDWTTIYTNTGLGKLPLQYIQAQAYNGTWLVDNLAAAQEFIDYDSDMVGIGDSICVGLGGAGTTIYTRIEALQGIPTLNSGIGAQTTNNIVARFDRDAVSYQPKKISVTAGTNDYYYTVIPIDTTIANFTSMLAMCNAATPPIELIINEVPPITDHGLGGSIPSGLTIEQQQERTKMINGALKKFAVDNNLKFSPAYQDIAYNDTAHEDDIAAAYDYDLTHFTAAGYSAIGDKYNIAAIPSRMFRWGNAAYPAVDDEGWSWWVKSVGASVSGDANTGTLVLPTNSTADGPVKSIETGTVRVTITPTVSSGTASIYYRTSASNYSRNDAAAWTLYTGPFTPSGQFIQVRLKGTSVADANISESSMTWTLNTGEALLLFF